MSGIGGEIILCPAFNNEFLSFDNGLFADVGLFYIFYEDFDYFDVGRLFQLFSILKSPFANMLIRKYLLCIFIL